MNEFIRQPVRQVVELLEAGRYSGLEALTHGIADVVEIAGSKKQWPVVMPLWTKEEGRSDLSIVLTGLRRGSRVATVSAG